MKPRLGAADVLTMMRFPLAALFPFAARPLEQLVIVALAGVTDLAHGAVARRTGGSRWGPMLDPVADKVFVATTVLTFAGQGLLHPLEIAAVLLRDIVAVLGFAATALLRRPVALPARAGGKAVTVSQGLTLVALIAASPLVRPLAWATGAVSVYAIWDYGRAVRRGDDGSSRNTPTPEA
ncbi:MAG: CDP-alcohol phosphatidyltransferase family protein [Gemmatimonadales bacterium]